MWTIGNDQGWRLSSSDNTNHAIHRAITTTIRTRKPPLKVAPNSLRICFRLCSWTLISHLYLPISHTECQDKVAWLISGKSSFHRLHTLDRLLYTWSNKVASSYSLTRWRNWYRYGLCVFHHCRSAGIHENFKNWFASVAEILNGWSQNWDFAPFHFFRSPRQSQNYRIYSSDKLLNICRPIAHLVVSEY